jgi:hypothetical protein
MDGCNWSSAKDMFVPFPFLLRVDVDAAGTRTMAQNDNGGDTVLADNETPLPTVVIPLFSWRVKTEKVRKR